MFVRINKSKVKDLNSPLCRFTTQDWDTIYHVFGHFNYGLEMNVDLNNDNSARDSVIAYFSCEKDVEYILTDFEVYNKAIFDKTGDLDKAFDLRNSIKLCRYIKKYVLSQDDDLNKVYDLQISEYIEQAKDKQEKANVVSYEAETSVTSA